MRMRSSRGARSGRLRPRGARRRRRRSSRSWSRTSASRASSAPRPAPSSATCRSRSARRMTDEKAQQAIRALFATGFFKDVRLEVDGDVLVVTVEERPAIAQIDFVGMKEFRPTRCARRCARSASPRAASSTGRCSTRRSRSSSASTWRAASTRREVTTTVTPLERNRVAINFTVDEGEVAKIRAINIVGNQAFNESELLDLFTLRTPGWLTWYTKNDQYSRQKLSGDLETLRSYYLNRGYLEFTIDSTQVSITPDKQRHLHHDQRHRRATSTRSPRCRSRGHTARARGRAAQAGPAQAGRRVLAREADRVAPRRSPSASATTATRSPTSTPCPRSTGQAHGRVHDLRRSRAAACTCGASTSSATQARATR